MRLDKKSDRRIAGRRLSDQILNVSHQIWEVIACVCTGLIEVLTGFRVYRTADLLEQIKRHIFIRFEESYGCLIELMQEMKMQLL